MPGNNLLEYIGSQDFTLTGLHSLPANSSFTDGWTSNYVDNQPDEFEDYLISGELWTHASNRKAGTIYIYAYTSRGDGADLEIFSDADEGVVDGTAAVHSSEVRDSVMKLVKPIVVNATASEKYGFSEISIASFFGWKVPDRWALWITGDASTGTTAQLAATGSILTYTGIHGRYT